MTGFEPSTEKVFVFGILLRFKAEGVEPNSAAANTFICRFKARVFNTNANVNVIVIRDKIVHAAIKAIDTQLSTLVAETFSEAKCGTSFKISCRFCNKLCIFETNANPQHAFLSRTHLQGYYFWWYEQLH